MRKVKLTLLSLLALGAMSLASCTGAQGEKGDKGDQGEQGPQGEPGENGEDGEDGSLWYTGEGVPSADLGKEGDMYLDTSSNDIYQKEASGWVLKTNIQGDKGEDGEDGENGRPGSDGSNGKTAWSNTILPSIGGYVTVDTGSAIVGTKITFTITPIEGNGATSFKLDETEISLEGCYDEESKSYIYETTMKENGYVVSASFSSLTETVLYKEGQPYTGAKIDIYGNVFDYGTLDNSSNAFEGGSGSEDDPLIIGDLNDLTSMNSLNYGSNVEVFFEVSENLTLEKIEKPTVTTASIMVKENQNFILDLNGSDLIGNLITDNVDNNGNYARAHVIYNNGNLTIKDSKGDGKIVDSSQSANACTRVIRNDSKGTLILDGVSVESTKAVCLINSGYCEIYDSSLNSIAEIGTGGWDNSSAAIENRSRGQLKIYNSEITSKSRAALFCDGYEPGYVNIYSGTFNGAEEYGSINGSSAEDIVTLYGGTFCSNVYNYLHDDYYFDEESKSVLPASLTNINVNNDSEFESALNQFNNLDIEQKHINIVVNGEVNFDKHIRIPRGSRITVNETLVFGENGYISNFDALIVNGKVEGVGELDNGVYKISDPMDLQWLKVIAENNENIKVELTEDITLPENSTFEPIDEFIGEIDGKEHKISNVVMSAASKPVGFIRYLYNSNIHDLTIEGLKITTTTSYVGGLAAYALGETTIENVVMSGEIDVKGNSYGISPFVGAIFSDNCDIEFINCAAKVNINAPNGYNCGSMYGTSSGSFGTIGVYNCSNEGTIIARGSIGVVFGWGNLKEGSKLEIIGFNKNKGSVKDINGNEITSCLGGSASDKAIYIHDYDDGDKYVAIQNSDGTWTHQDVGV